MSTSYEERRRKAQAAAPRNNKGKVVAAAALVALLVLVAVGWAIWSQQSHKSEVAQKIANASTPPNATADGGGIVANPGKAKAGAPTLVIYEDFQCPICKQVEDAVGPTVTKLSDEGKIKLEYHLRSFLDENIKRAMPTVPNPDSSLRSAAAASCADAAGSFKAYHDVVFKHQPEEGKGYTDQQLRVDLAQEAGLSGDALDGFQSCVQDKKMIGFATKMEQVGQQKGNTGTPQYLLNGKEIPFQTFAQDPAKLEQAVAAATK
ncbi:MULTISPECIES: DsbA family protein [Arsenicicoccus]|uniref:DsbA family protein n=1 Tax=Arsenicicoccus TaxID=267408 RepID=UPI000406DD0F|nr:MULTISPECIES: thioredoxin domain-containing protein [Arsenicicoccus]